jgi:hypothetical protein
MMMVVVVVVVGCWLCWCKRMRFDADAVVVVVVVATEKIRKTHVAAAALRMVLVLAGMLLCNMARAVVLYMDVLRGIMDPVKYYVGYMVCEALPLIPILVLALVTFYNARHVDYVELGRRKADAAKADSVPLLQESTGDYDY